MQEVHFLKFQYTRFKKCAKSAMGCDLFRHSQLGAPQKEKKSGGPGHVPSVPIG